MRSTLALFILLLLFSHTHAQTRGQASVPSVVLNSFFENFPRAQRPSWRSSETYYFATFNNSGYRMIAQYTRNGKWVRTQITLRFSDLPKITQNHYYKYYRNYQVVAVKFNDQLGNKFYQIDIGAGGRRKVLRYDENGYPRR